MSSRLLTACLLLCTSAALPAPAQGQTAQPQDTFTNPLLPSGPDPWVIAYRGTYYYMNTTGRNLTIWATPDITDLRHARRRVVWTPPPDGPYSKEIWAPELHRFDDRWYLYFTADAGSNESHRIWVLENPSEDPLEGTWTMKGQIKDRGDHWAIDPSAFELNGSKYLIWSGWKGTTDGEQDIYIA
ncbi:MAG TPA: family 43 glycosylhydrolase, partial [Acidobacteriaceae bacterium]|nr:family 43 glycosylhydrolase [Acidobacteriaceae bacterium]